MLVLYSLLLTLMLPVILARLLWRSLRQPGYRDNIAERFGSYSQPALRGCIWIHAVSVGETRATEPLIRKLKALYPSRPILLTSMTPTGRAAAIEMFGDSLTSAYLPYDLGYWHRGLFERFEPVALLVMETEIWPNLFHACKSRSVPALIVNARLSERSARGYQRFAPVRVLRRSLLLQLPLYPLRPLRRSAQPVACRQSAKGYSPLRESCDECSASLLDDWFNSVGGRVLPDPVR